MDFIGSLNTLWFYQGSTAFMAMCEVVLLIAISRKDDREHNDGYEKGRKDGFSDGFAFAIERVANVPAELDIALSLDASALIDAVQAAGKSTGRYAPDKDDQPKKETKPK